MLGIGTFQVAGGLSIGPRGLAAYISIGVDAFGDFGRDIGLEFTATGILQINTASTRQNVPVGTSQQPVDPGFSLEITGTVNFLGFAKANGRVSIEIVSGRFQVEFEVQLQLGGLQVSAAGGAAIYTGANSGMALVLDVTINADIFSIIEINASGKLLINTSDVTRTLAGRTLAAESFKLALTGEVVFLKVLSFSASFTIDVGEYLGLGSGGWRVSFSASLDFFGIVTVSANGWFNSKGHFDLSLSGRLVFGTDDWGASGNFSIRVWLYQLPSQEYTFGISASGSLKIRAFGITFAGVSVSFTVSATGAGRVPVQVEANATVTILGIDFSVDIDFTFGYIELPKPIFLAGNYVAGSNLTAKAWTPATSGGNLVLNMGARNAERGIGEGQAGEAYFIEHVSGDANGETIRVTFSGRTQEFSGVKKIYAFGDAGADQLTIGSGVLVPIEFDGGAGADVLIHNGSGFVTFNGREGNDYAELNGTADGLINGQVGVDNVLINSSVGVEVDGGDDSDQITGGSGNDILRGGDGNDVIDGRAGVDSIFGDGGNDQIRWTMSAANLTTVEGGTGSDTLVVTASSAADTIEVTSPTGGKIKVARTTGIVGSITGKDIETVQILTGAGADTVTVGFVKGGGATRIEVDAGPSSAADLLTILGSEMGADTVTLTDDATFADAIAAAMASTAGSGNNYSVVLRNAVRADGDRIVASTLAGNDRVDGSSVTRNRAALTVIAGAGDDVVIGTRFDDVLNTGLGNDTVTGGLGFDVFVETSNADGIDDDGDLTIDEADENGIDEIVETFDLDVGLYNDKLVVGQLLNGADQAFAANTNASTQVSTFADRFAKGAVVESLGNLFEKARVNGAAGNNSFVVSDPDSQIRVANDNLSVIAWRGEARLDNAGNSSSFDENYLVAVTANTNAVIVIADTGTDGRADRVVMFSSTEGDRFTLSHTGSGASTVSSIVATVGQPPAAPATLPRIQVTASGIERIEIDTREANDNVAIRSNGVAVSVNGGLGADLVMVGSNASADGIGTIATSSRVTTVTEAGGPVTRTTATIALAGNVVAGQVWSVVLTAGDEVVTVSRTALAGDTLATIASALATSAGTRPGYAATHAPGETRFTVTRVGSFLVDGTVRGGGNLEAIDAALTLAGEGASDGDRLWIDDSSDAAANTGALSATALTGLGAAGITHAGFENIDIGLGGATGGNVFTVLSTPTRTVTTVIGNAGIDAIGVETIDGATTIRTGAGADVVAVGKPVAGGRTVNDIDRGLLTVDGEAGIDALVVSDDGDTAADAGGKLTATRISGLGMEIGLAYGRFESLALALSNGNNAFHVEGTHAGSTTIDTGDETAVTNAFNDIITVEKTGGFTEITLGGGNDIVRVNYFANGRQTFLSGLGGELRLHGGNGGDHYDIGLSGLAGALIRVTDAPENPLDTGVDELNIFGTNSDDFFLFRASKTTGYGIVAAIQVDANRQPVVGGFVERIEYDGSIDGAIQVFGRDGNDTFVFDDTRGTVVAYGDDGDDVFQIGQVFASARDETNPANGLGAQDWFDTTPITRGYLSNGISFPATLRGGAGKDTFTVYSNKAELFLFGDEDDDTFVVRAFVRVDPLDRKAPYTNINGGQGADFISFTVNAPVRVDGGDGFDTITVVGTEFGDDFVVNEDGVFGAGLFVTYTGIERLVVDALEGNDTFFIAGTPEGVAVEIVGGRGSDSFNVGGSDGKAITVVSNGLEGHSGLVINTVDSTDSRYKAIFVQDVSTRIGDNDEAGIIILKDADTLRVFEDPNADASLMLVTYQVVLTRAPEETVRVTARAVKPSEGDQKAGGKGVRLNGAEDGVTLLFDRTNWFKPQTIYVTAPNDRLAEGRRVVNITHSVVEGAVVEDGDAYDGLTVPGVIAEVIDDDVAEVLIVPIRNASSPIDVQNDTTVVEGATGAAAALATDSFAVVLTKAPVGQVVVTLENTDTPRQLTLSTSTLTFGTADWNRPQIVNVSAANDNLKEGIHFGRIRATIAPADVNDFLGVTSDQVAAGLVATVNRDVDQDRAAEVVYRSIDVQLLQPQGNKDAANATVGISTGDRWVLTLNGVAYAYTLQSGDTLADIAEEIADLLPAAFTVVRTDARLTISNAAGFTAAFSVEGTRAFGGARIASTDGAAAVARISGSAFEVVPSFPAGSSPVTVVPGQRAWDLATITLSGAVTTGATWILVLDGVEYSFTAPDTSDPTKPVDMGTIVDGLIGELRDSKYIASASYSQATIQLSGIADAGESWVLAIDGVRYVFPTAGSVPPSLSDVSLAEQIRSVLGANFTVTAGADNRVTLAKTNGSAFRLVATVENGDPGDEMTVTGVKADKTVIYVEKAFGLVEVRAFSAEVFRKTNAAAIDRTSGGTIAGTASTTHWQVADVVVPYDVTIARDQAWSVQLGTNISNAALPADAATYGFVAGRNREVTQPNPIDVRIADDDSPSVLILESQGRTVLVEPSELVVIGSGSVQSVTTGSGSTIVFRGDFGSASVREVGINDSVFTAQDLDLAKWTNAADAAVATPYPHLTVIGTGDGSNDFYRFEITADMLAGAGADGVKAVFDIDAGYQPNDAIFWGSWLKIYSTRTVTAGDTTRVEPVLLARGPGFSFPTQGGTGSTSWWDDYLEYNFKTAGVYYVEVGDWFNRVMPLGVDYLLHVSIENHAFDSFVFAPQPILEDENAQNSTGYQVINDPNFFYTFFDRAVGDTELGGSIDFLVPYARIVGSGDNTIDRYRFVISNDMLNASPGTVAGTVVSGDYFTRVVLRLDGTTKPGDRWTLGVKFADYAYDATSTSLADVANGLATSLENDAKNAYRAEGVTFAGNAYLLIENLAGFNFRGLTVDGIEHRVAAAGTVTRSMAATAEGSSTPTEFLSADVTLTGSTVAGDAWTLSLLNPSTGAVVKSYTANGTTLAQVAQILEGKAAADGYSPIAGGNTDAVVRLANTAGFGVSLSVSGGTPQGQATITGVTRAASTVAAARWSEVDIDFTGAPHVGETWTLTVGSATATKVIDDAILQASNPLRQAVAALRGQLETQLGASNVGGSNERITFGTGATRFAVSFSISAAAASGSLSQTAAQVTVVDTSALPKGNGDTWTFTLTGVATPIAVTAGGNANAFIDSVRTSLDGAAGYDAARVGDNIWIVRSAGPAASSSFTVGLTSTVSGGSAVDRSSALTTFGGAAVTGLGTPVYGQVWSVTLPGADADGVLEHEVEYKGAAAKTTETLADVLAALRDLVQASTPYEAEVIEGRIVIRHASASTSTPLAPPVAVTAPDVTGKAAIDGTVAPRWTQTIRLDGPVATTDFWSVTLQSSGKSPVVASDIRPESALLGELVGRLFETLATGNATIGYKLAGDATVTLVDNGDGSFTAVDSDGDAVLANKLQQRRTAYERESSIAATGTDIDPTEQDDDRDHYSVATIELAGSFIPGEVWNYEVNGRTYDYKVPAASTLSAADRDLLTVAEGIVAEINAKDPQLAASISAVRAKIDLGGTVTVGQVWSIELKPVSGAALTATYKVESLVSLGTIVDDLVAKIHAGSAFNATRVGTTNAIDVTKVFGSGETNHDFEITLTVSGTGASNASLTTGGVLPTIRIEDKTTALRRIDANGDALATPVSVADHPFAVSFDREATVTGVFDIDRSTPVTSGLFFSFWPYTTTTVLEVYNVDTGALVDRSYFAGAATTSRIDTGSTTNRDPFLKIDFRSAATYEVRVSSVINFEPVLGFAPAPLLLPYVASGLNYELLVSLQRQATNPKAVELVNKILTVVDGPGAGQSAEIVSYDAETGTYVLQATTPWTQAIAAGSKYDISLRMSLEYPEYRPVQDSYKVVLTVAPEIGKDVTVTVASVKTRTYNADQAFNADEGFGANEQVQTRVATPLALVTLAGSPAAGETWTVTLTGVEADGDLVAPVSVQQSAAGLSLLQIADALASKIAAKANFTASATAGAIRIGLESASTIARFYVDLAITPETAGSAAIETIRKANRQDPRASDEQFLTVELKGAVAPGEQWRIAIAGDAKTYAVTSVFGDDLASIADKLAARIIDLDTTLVYDVSVAGRVITLSYRATPTVAPAATFTITPDSQGSAKIESQLVFTSTDWFVPQDVFVMAIDDAIVDGGDALVFPELSGRVNAVRGPLTIEGGERVGSERFLNDPFRVPGETNLPQADGSIAAITFDAAAGQMKLVDWLATHANRLTGERPGFDPRMNDFDFAFTFLNNATGGLSGAFGQSASVVSVGDDILSFASATPFNVGLTIERGGVLQSLAGSVVFSGTPDQADAAAISWLQSVLQLRGEPSLDETWAVSLIKGTKTYGYSITTGASAWTLSVINPDRSTLPVVTSLALGAGDLSLAKIAERLARAIRDDGVFQAETRIDLIGNTKLYIAEAGFNPAAPSGTGFKVAVNVTGGVQETGALFSGTPLQSDFSKVGIEWTLAALRVLGTPTTGDVWKLALSSSELGTVNASATSTGTVGSITDGLALKLPSSIQPVVSGTFVTLKQTAGNPAAGDEYVYQPVNPNISVNETEQVDTMVVDNANAPTDGEALIEGVLAPVAPGTLTKDRLTGLGMGGDTTIAGRALNGGITYGGLEVVDIRLGTGNDVFTVESTHLGATRISAGNGNDRVVVKTIDGHTSIDAGAGDDAILVGGDTALVDQITGLLSIDGGTGRDSVSVDDSGDVNDNTLVVTAETITGLDMPTVEEQQSIFVQAASGVYTLRIDGYGTAQGFTSTGNGVVRGTTFALVTLDFADDAATVKSRLATLFGFNDLRVTETRTARDVTYTIAWTGPRAGIDFVPFSWNDTNEDPATQRDALELGFAGQAAIGDVWTLTLGGAVFDTTVGSTDTIETVVAALAAKVDLSAAFTATSSGAVLSIRSTAGLFTYDFASSIGVATATLRARLVPTPDASADVKITTLRDGTTAPALNNVQTITIDATGGTFTLTFMLPDANGTLVPATTAELDHDATVAELREALDKLLNPNNEFGSLPHTDNYAVSRVGKVITLVFQGEHRDLSIARLDTSKLVGTETTATITIAGSATVAADGWSYTGATADAIAAQINTWQGPHYVATVDGNVLTLTNRAGDRFDLTLAGAATAQTDVALVRTRVDGIDYRDVEILGIELGAGSDVVNVRGTSAITTIDAGAGNDRFYVSSAAALTPSTTTDFLAGHLNDVDGDLHLLAGTGQHTLMISDEAARTGDTNVLVTDDRAAALARNAVLPINEIYVLGLATGAITYGADATGDFRGGISVWTGFGNDTVRIDGTIERAGLRTVTQFNTGLGDDAVTVELDATGPSADGFFVLNTQGPYDQYLEFSDVDTVRAAASTLPLVIFGGQGNDDIQAGQGRDIVFGDRGRVEYTNAAGALVMRLGQAGPGDLVSSLILDAVRLYSVASFAGGADTVFTFAADDIVVGGINRDVIDAGEGNNIVFGDGGRIDWIVADDDRSDIDLIVSEFVADGGNDDITTGAGDDIVIAGADGQTIVNQTVAGQRAVNRVATLEATSGDVVRAGDGRNLVLGDNGRITAAVSNVARFGTLPITLGLVETIEPTVGGVDAITTGTGGDIALGGNAGDTLTLGAGDNIALGDHGLIDWTRGERTAGVPGADTDASDIDLIESTATNLSVGGVDTITTNGGTDIALGGDQGDTISLGDGRNLALGDHGRITAAVSNVARFGTLPITLGLVETIEPTVGGVDAITTGAGSDIALGGNAGDTLTLGAGDNIALGDHGLIDWTRGERTAGVPGADTDASDIDLIESTATNLSVGGVDTITTNGGTDIALGGDAGDTISLGDGRNLALGDHGRITAANSNVASARFGTLPITLGLVETIEPTVGGVDAITTGTGGDIALGGNAGDTLTLGAGDNIALGDHGLIDWTRGERTAGVPGADTDASDIDLIESTATNLSVGGVDTITTNGGTDIALGGDQGDTISLGDGRNLALGDHGRITAAVSNVARFGTLPITLGLVETIEPTVGGVDAITTGAGSDIALGGNAGDTLTLGAGDNIALGDHGLIDWTRGERTAGVPGADTDASDIDLIESTATNLSVGGVDTITTNGGTDIALGGDAGDTISLGDGRNLALGDHGRITAANESGTNRFGTLPITLGLVETIEPTVGGVDAITTGAGSDIALGGNAGDTLTLGAGDNIALGDHGLVDWTRAERVAAGTPGADTDASDIDLIESTAVNDGGADTITTLGGTDIVIGGLAGDAIDTRDSSVPSEGRNLVLGDHGRITAANDNASRFGTQPITLGLVETIAPAVGGADTIGTGRNADIVLGGAAGDTIRTNFGEVYVRNGVGNVLDGDNIVLGDNGFIDWTRAERNGDVGGDTTAADIDRIETTDPTIGGNDTITTGGGNDFVIGGTGNDTINAGAGNDLVFGDHGSIAAIAQASGGRVDAQLLPLLGLTDLFTFTAIFTQNAQLGGNDTIFGEDGRDIVLGQQGDDVIYGGNDDDDLIGGHNVAGGQDGNDRIDGSVFRNGGTVLPAADGTDNDVILGDNGSVLRRGDALSDRFRVLAGSLLYDANDNALVTAAAQLDPAGVQVRTIVLFDHSFTPAAGTSGADYLAGGPDDDMIFGGLGDDTIQGDGAVLTLAAGPTDVFARRLADGTLSLNASFANGRDGDDYIEGNGGNDTVFGGLGQDDIIGGSSDLFGLTDRLLRPDGADMIFGGTGQDVARNTFGDPASNGHARDADTILGDNGRILRVVTPVAGGTQFVSFNYDVNEPGRNGYAAGTLTGLNFSDRWVVVRATAWLDYTAGGVDFNATAAALDIGAADEIHGEGGDDSIHGMRGGDVLYGEGQDDDLVGGYGHDWISGGTGTDGVIGDDGRIYTSRNSSTYGEPLFGIAAIAAADLNLTISTPGQGPSALINVNGEIFKTVNLTPFNLTPSTLPDNPLYDAVDADDLIFGGLGDDFLHGGAGDDLISGAEALPLSFFERFAAYTTPSATRTGTITRSDYAAPFNPGNVLGFDARRAGKFAAYDANDPLRRITFAGFGEFLGNFDASDAGAAAVGNIGTATVYSDGKDRLFGDLGNDWLVGGTGKDQMYGGFGNDLHQADDNLGTAAGLNNTTDTHPTYEDIAFGGAGRDVLIANTGGDRLIDWNGEFNSYYTPFSAFGAGTVIRAGNPAMQTFLYTLSRADGADRTRAADDGTSAARNGEPNGEIGLVTNGDAAFGDQQGSPDDPQPGNTNGPRDVQGPTSTAIAIADNSLTTATITIDRVATIADIDVTLSINHGRLADLTATLISPTGVRIQLFTGLAGSGAIIPGATFDDEAGVAIAGRTGPFIGGFRPTGNLASLEGASAAGAWRLEIRDAAGGQTGTLNSWSITIRAGTPLTAESIATSPAAAATHADVAALASAAVQVWADSGLVSDAQRVQLDNIAVRVADLGGATLALTEGLRITVDADAAGHGWFVDPTPMRNEEFAAAATGAMTARAGSAAEGRIDLLSVLVHEIGHVLGYEHEDATSVAAMAEMLATGTRLLIAPAGSAKIPTQNAPSAVELAAIFAPESTADAPVATQAPGSETAQPVQTGPGNGKQMLPGMTASDRAGRGGSTRAPAPQTVAGLPIAAIVARAMPPMTEPQGEGTGSAKEAIVAPAVVEERPAVGSDGRHQATRAGASSELDEFLVRVRLMASLTSGCEPQSGWFY